MSASTSSGPRGLAGLLSRGVMWRYKSGESKCLPIELEYFRRIRSRKSSTKASLLMGMSVAEPPGRFTHIFRYSTRAPDGPEVSAGVASLPATCSKALRRAACGSAVAWGAEVPDMEDVGVAIILATASWSRKTVSAAEPSS